MKYTPLLQQMISALQSLPGIGPKSAQRMAFHLLERDRKNATRIGEALLAGVEHIGNCEQCRIYSEEPLCGICDSPERNHSLLCIVESPADVVAFENSIGFTGVYFVLGGRLSPLDGIGPQELGLHDLEARLQEGVITELVLATNSTVEGEATAQYIAEMAQQCNIVASRLAQGVPIGGELDMIDGGTLSHAFSDRKVINNNQGSQI